MGVSGSGKTSVGLHLAKILSIPFYDADDFHSDISIKKMKKGYPLNDSDRMPWLKLLSSKIKEWNSQGDSVLACSALKESYRKILSDKNELTLIFLYGSYDLIYDRLTLRENHFFSKKMLKKQFQDLERPAYGINIDINQSVEEIGILIRNVLKI
jgi:carbohydrate kinase (thermoresistant glucokinase family)